jgi:predicted phage terminase large subunit-like protein
MPIDSAWNVGDVTWPTSLKLPEPTKRQALALAMDWKREILFGGAAGGGKSVYLLLAALQFVDWPEYRALVLRRTFAQLSIAQGLLELAQEWLGGCAMGCDTVGGYPTKWRFRSGATLDFGHVQHLKDRTNYQGGGWHFIGFDELTQFPEGAYTYVAFSRRRRQVSSRVPLRVRATSNPGGEGHEWVRQRFIVEASPITDASSFVSDGRTFVSSKLRDNPFIDAAEYERDLAELHPYERAMLLDGDWDVRSPGSFFDRAWFATLDQVPGRVVESVRFWDLAATEPKSGTDPDWTVGTLVHRIEGGPVDFVVADVDRSRLKPGPLEQRVESVARGDGPAVVQVIEQEPGSSGKIASTALGRVLDGLPVRFDRPTGNKASRAAPFASAASQGRVGVLRRPWLTDWIRELESFPGGAHDDQVDSASGAYARLAIVGGVRWSDLYPDSPQPQP